MAERYSIYILTIIVITSCGEAEGFQLCCYPPEIRPASPAASVSKHRLGKFTLCYAVTE